MLEEPNFRGLVASRDDNGDDDDDELAVLPRNTKVIVTGNNRTKSALVGLHGVVKKAVGLGGWHWLELTNGMEVKLQRNALTVIEQPTEIIEQDTTADQCEVESSSSSDIAAAVVAPAAADAPKDHLHTSGTEFRKPRKPKVRRPRSWVVSTDESENSESKESNGSVDVPISDNKNNSTQSRLDFSKLGTDSLARYCQHYQLFPTGSNHAVSRGEMIKWVSHHFASQIESDKKVVKDTVRAVKKPRQEENDEIIDIED